MNPVILHNKTYQERLEEYRDVLLVPTNGHLSAPEIQKQWSSYLPFALDSTGWLAVWKLPRLTCEQLQIEFPLTAFVYVEFVDFHKLTAGVKILATHNDIQFPTKRFVVALIELWPTKKQDEQINLKQTANCLDMLRVFYLYIFMPWDLEENNCTNWVNEHLESRLTLFYDVRSHKFPRPVAIHIKDLITEARHLHDSHNPDCLKIRIRMIQIRNEFEFLENPLLRGAFLRKQLQLSPKITNSNSSTHIVVFQQNKIDECIYFLNEANLHTGQHDVRFMSNLNSALEYANINDSIILSKSRHIFDNFGVLQEGGNLKGLYSKGDTIVESTKEDIVFDCCGNVTFENLTVHVQFAQCGILVRQGNVTLKNCKIVCNYETHVCDGVIVLNGATLNVIDCDISGFKQGVVANSGASILLKNCSISNVGTGLRIYDNCIVKLESCLFKRCEEFGIDVDTSTPSVDCQTGDFEILKIFPHITINSITGDDNGIDSNVNCIDQSDVVQDLLASQSDDSGDDSSDDVMDTTVLHIKSF